MTEKFYIVQKRVKAKNIVEALKLEKTADVEEVYEEKVGSEVRVGFNTGGD